MGFYPLLRGPKLLLMEMLEFQAVLCLNPFGIPNFCRIYISYLHEIPTTLTDLYIPMGFQDILKPYPLRTGMDFL